jgi:hypothetical protein
MATVFWWTTLSSSSGSKPAECSSPLLASTYHTAWVVRFSVKKMNKESQYSKICSKKKKKKKKKKIQHESKPKKSWHLKKFIQYTVCNLQYSKESEYVNKVKKVYLRHISNIQSIQKNKQSFYVLHIYIFWDTVAHGTQVEAHFHGELMFT